MRRRRHFTNFFFPFLSLNLFLFEAATHNCWIRISLHIFFSLQMMDGKTKIGPLEIMFLSVQLVETGKAISVRQEPSRTDLERKYYLGLLEIEVP